MRVRGAEICFSSGAAAVCMTCEPRGGLLASSFFTSIYYKKVYSRRLTSPLLSVSDGHARLKTTLKIIKYKLRFSARLAIVIRPKEWPNLWRMSWRLQLPEGT